MPTPTITGAPTRKPLPRAPASIGQALGDSKVVAPTPAAVLAGTTACAEGVAASTKELRSGTDTIRAPLTHGGGAATLGFLCRALKESSCKPSEPPAPPAPPAPPIRPTEILSTRVERTVIDDRKVDPLSVELEIDPRVAFVAIVNAERFDPQGRPLLLGLIARDGADRSKLDLSGLCPMPGPPEPPRLIRADAKRAELRSFDDSQFDFGTPIVQISFDAKGAEVNRSARTRPANDLTRHVLTRNDHRVERTVGDVLDTRPVQISKQHLRVALEGAPAGWWPDDPASAGWPKLRLDADAKVLQQPGARATITIQGAYADPYDSIPRYGSPLAPQLALSVASNDASFQGNAPVRSAAIEFARFDQDVLDARVTIESASNSMARTGAPDAAKTQATLRDLLRTHRQAITVGGEHRLVETESIRLGEDRGGLGARPATNGSVALSLAEGYLEAAGGASLEGYTVTVGRMGSDGFRPLARRTLDASPTSNGLDFLLTPAALATGVPSAPLEVRITDDRGVPFHRVKIDLAPGTR